jgi:putative ABC transport system permease protein
VICEVALALVLLTSAGLLLQSFWRLQRVPLGFNPANTLAGDVLTSRRTYPKPEDAVRFYRNLQERLSALPGIRSASAITPLPLTEGEWESGFIIEGQPSKKSEQPITDFRIATPGYFRTMGIALLQGRDFDQRDRTDSSPVVIVNETMARRFFPNENPIGKRIAPQSGIGPGDPPMREIIGVVADVRFRGPGIQPKPESYVPHSQYGLRGLTLVVRGDSAAAISLAPTIRQVLSEIDKGVPFYNVRTLNQYVSTSLARPRLGAVLLSVFAGVALLLTAIGIYGVIAYSVAQRRQEIGIRLALGAQKADVLKLVVGGGMKLATLGVLIGFAAALALTRLLSNLLYGVSPIDAATLISVAVLLASIALLASWLPARRAAGINPWTTLRDE